VIDFGSLFQLTVGLNVIDTVALWQGTETVTPLPNFSIGIFFSLKMQTSELAECTRYSHFGGI